jgi:hypothetical protein
MTRVNEGSQQAVDEDELVFRPASLSPLAQPRGQLDLVPLMVTDPPRLRVQQSHRPSGQ